MTTLLKCLSALAIASSALAFLKPAQAFTLITTSDRQIGSVDAQTVRFTGLLAGQSYTDIALNRQGDLWGSTFGTLFQIDLANQQQRQVGGFGASINGLGFSDQDELYATGGSNFYQVDLTNGQATVLGNHAAFQSSGDLVFDPVQQRFFATSRAGNGSDRLFAFDLTGGAIEIGDIGFNRVYGLFFEEGVLYGHTSDRQQLTIDLNTGQGQFQQSLTGLSSEVWGTASLPTTGSLPAASGPQSVPEPSMLLSLLGLGGLAWAGIRQQHK